MKINKDGSAILDKWDMRAMFELGTGSWKDKDINQMKKNITKTIFHRIWYKIKYPKWS